MIEADKIHATTSALTVVNSAYILKKVFGSDIMLNKVDALCQLLDVIPLEKHQLQSAVRLRPYDYEDAVQYLSALPYHPAPNAKRQIRKKAK